jgi:lipopolysaccharide export system permease protein
MAKADVDLEGSGKARETGVLGNLLQRAIFWELLKAFVLALVALTSILLLAGIVAEASQRGLSPGQILVAIPLIIPSLMPYAIPSTTLFATCLVYGRLAHDNEIIAIKAAGINILTVIWPAVTLGLLTGAITLGLYYEVIPETQYYLRVQFIKDAEEFLYTMLKNERCVNQPRLSYAIWVRQVQGHRLLDATFKRRDLKDPKGPYDLVVRAREAELRVDTRNKQLLVHMRNGAFYSVTSGTWVWFEDRVWPVPMSDNGLMPDQDRKAREMTLGILNTERAKLVDKISALVTEIGETTAQMALQGASDSLPQHRRNLQAMQSQLVRNLSNIDLELYLRPVISFGCMCFVLVGCPVGIWFSKRDYLSAFITCFLPIVVLYYPLLLCGINLTRNSRGNPAVNLWMCNALMLVMAMYMLRRLVRN